MTALATVADVEARLGRSLSVEETAKAEVLLTDASALVVSYTGQRFLTGQAVNLLRIKQNKIRLTQRPVTAVNDVTDTDGNELPFVWDNFQTVTVDCSVAPNQTHVIVDYNFGTANAPDDVVAVVSGMVARTISIPTEAVAGIQQQTVGPFSVTYANWAVGGQVLMSPADREVLDRYRIRTFGMIETLG